MKESLGGNFIKTPDYQNSSEVLEREKVKEVFFRQFIETGIELELFNQIKQSGFTDQEIMELRDSFSRLNEQEKEYAYALPYELRKKNFTYQIKNIRSGKKTTADFWLPVIEIGIKNGRALGYHCSASNITPEQTTDSLGQKIEHWEIYGTEADHRNNDLPMAYYSEDYLHLYRTKKAEYLYVISSQRASDSGHHQDNSNKWGRASHLSVVQKFNLPEVDQFVENRVKEYFEQKENRQAIA